jgi:hypothetical protein
VADVIELGTALVGAIFGAGVAYASVNASIKAVKIDASTALQQANEALARIAVEKERSTRQEGVLQLHNERITTARQALDDLWPAVFRPRAESNRGMPAVRGAPRPDERRDDSDPPPMRPRLQSRRGE